MSTSLPPAAHEPIVELHRAGAIVLGGLVVSAQSEFDDALVTIDFPRDETLDLPVGAPSSVCFRGGPLGGKHTLTGRVVFSSVDAIRHRYQFRFRGEARRTLGPLVNQRNAMRVQPNEDDPVRALLAPPAGDDRHAVRVLDLSGTGMSVRVTPDVETALHACWTPRVFLFLPGEAMPMELRGRIRHRRLVSGGVQYGVEFRAQPAPGFTNLQERIYRYVMAKHGRDLGEERGRTPRRSA